MPLLASYFTRGEGTDQANPIHTSLIRKMTFTNALVGDLNGYSVAHTGKASSGTQGQTLGGALCADGVGTADFARNVVITVTHSSSIVAMNGVITGTDINGRVMTEVWAVTATGTSKTVTGLKAFKTVTGITEIVAADASTNTIISGTGATLGLDRKCAIPTLVKETSAGSVVTNGTVVAAGTATTADAFGTYAPNTPPDDTTDYQIWFLVDDWYTTPNPTA